MSSFLFPRQIFFNVLNVAKIFICGKTRFSVFTFVLNVWTTLICCRFTGMSRGEVITEIDRQLENALKGRMQLFAFFALQQNRVFFRATVHTDISSDWLNTTSTSTYE